MYYYVIRDTWTGEVLAEGTAKDLVSAGKYKNVESVNNAYNSWARRHKKGLETKLEWTRTGKRGYCKKADKETGEDGKRSSEARAHTKRIRSWKQKAARDALQGRVAAAARAKKPGGYTTEKLGDTGALPEHTKRFAQPPVAPPEAKGKDKPSALRWDVYELECLNWERRQQGKRALSYGEWRAGMR